MTVVACTLIGGIRAASAVGEGQRREREKRRFVIFVILGMVVVVQFRDGAGWCVWQDFGCW